MNDREFHEWVATQPIEEQLDLIDERYHNHLPEYANCHLCGIEHAAINPSEIR